MYETIQLFGACRTIREHRGYTKHPDTSSITQAICVSLIHEQFKRKCKIYNIHTSIHTHTQNLPQVFHAEMQNNVYFTRYYKNKYIIHAVTINIHYILYLAHKNQAVFQTHTKAIDLIATLIREINKKPNYHIHITIKKKRILYGIQTTKKTQTLFN